MNNIRQYGILAALTTMAAPCVCQVANPQADTTARQLETIVVRAFENRGSLIETAAAVGFITRRTINRFNNVSLVQAVNTVPGVRMEERSPGSYRINIRGSSQRSPFGVRNVKLYYNGIPFTDPAGQSYLNQLGFYNIQSIEILKGPAASMYGAGTGGVLLVNATDDTDTNTVTISATAASFNTFSTRLKISSSKNFFRQQLQWQKQSSDGYRQHSNMRRDVLSWNGVIQLNPTQELTASVLYGDLYYQTPGGLTRAEYEINPRQPRPTVGTSAGAVDKRAAIYQTMFLAGLNYRWQIAKQWQGSAVVYGTLVRVLNPTFLNYGRNHEPHFGGRAVVTKESKLLNISAGFELQQGYTTARSYQNNHGEVGSIITDDELNTRSYIMFAQARLKLKKIILSSGISLSRQRYSFNRLHPSQVSTQKNFSNELAPRLELLYKPSSAFSIYAIAAKGFSPPTGAEMLPSTGVLNTGLEPERGWNYELGSRVQLFKSALFAELNMFKFALQNAIVQRRDAAGADYFINAGTTSQVGLEATLHYRSLNSGGAWISYAHHNFKYKQFTRLNNDFSGNKLPGVPTNTLTVGLDYQILKQLLLQLTYAYGSSYPLNDAGTEYAEHHHVFSGRLNSNFSIAKNLLTMFVGIDNIFDVTYSLGNDINAFNGRCFNAATGRSLFIGLELKIATK